MKRLVKGRHVLFLHYDGAKSLIVRWTGDWPEEAFPFSFRKQDEVTRSEVAIEERQNIVGDAWFDLWESLSPGAGFTEISL